MLRGGRGSLDSHLVEFGIRLPSEKAGIVVEATLPVMEIFREGHLIGSRGLCLLVHLPLGNSRNPLSTCTSLGVEAILIPRRGALGMEEKLQHHPVNLFDSNVRAAARHNRQLGIGVPGCRNHSTRPFHRPKLLPMYQDLRPRHPPEHVLA